MIDGRRGRLLVMLVVVAAAAVSAVAQQQASDRAAGGISYFARFVVGGGWITWFILIPLSVAMVALVIGYAVSIRRATLLPEQTRQRMQQLCDQRQYRALGELVADDPSMLSQLVRAGLVESAGGPSAIQRAVDEASEQETARLLRRIEWLNLIGNISPMIGLFGTVTGMIQAFYELVEITAAGGVTNAAQLADAISLALVTTFWGLAIAIPALAAFAIFRNRLDALTAECALAAQQMLEPLARSASRPQAVQSESAAAAR